MFVYLWIKWQGSLCWEVERIVLPFPLFSLLTFSFSLSCLSIFFSIPVLFPTSIPFHLIALPQNFNIQNLRYYFIFLSSTSYPSSLPSTAHTRKFLFIFVCFLKSLILVLFGNLRILLPFLQLLVFSPKSWILWNVRLSCYSAAVNQGKNFLRNFRVFSSQNITLALFWNSRQ